MIDGAGSQTAVRGSSSTALKFCAETYSPLEGDGFELSVKIRPEENCGFPGPAISAIVPQTGAK